MVDKGKVRPVGSALHRLLAVTLLGLAPAALPGPGIAYGQDITFSNRNLEGSFGFSFSGSLLGRGDPTRQPVSAVGRLTADGKGNLTNVVRTVSWAGRIMQQVAVGTYQVNPDGTGTATLSVRTVGTDGRAVPASMETLTFVIAGDNSVIECIVTDWRGPNGEDLAVSPVIRWIGTKQAGMARGLQTTDLPPLPEVDPELPAVGLSPEMEAEIRKSLADAGVSPEEIEEQIRALKVKGPPR